MLGQTGTDKDKQGQTETRRYRRDRQGQTGTDRDRQGQTGTYGDRKTLSLLVSEKIIDKAGTKTANTKQGQEGTTQQKKKQTNQAGTKRDNEE